MLVSSSYRTSSTNHSKRSCSERSSSPWRSSASAMPRPSGATPSRRRTRWRRWWWPTCGRPGEPSRACTKTSLSSERSSRSKTSTRCSTATRGWQRCCASTRARSSPRSSTAETRSPRIPSDDEVEIESTSPVLPGSLTFGDAMRVINPYDNSKVAAYEPHRDAEVERRLQLAHDTFESWRQTSFATRATAMRRAAEVLRTRSREWGELMTREMGKPVESGVGEAEKCAWVCEYYADHAEAFLASEALESSGTRSKVAYRPLGPVLAVMPWNFPFWQVFRFAAPALMAGNVGLLKHASNVPGCALAIESILAEAGLPQGCFQTLLIGSDRVDAVIADRRVVAVTLTGSTPAGRAVASAAGRALKKTVLELGGSDPYIILEDADLDHAVKACVTSRLINSGQSCIAAKRFVVVDA